MPELSAGHWVTGREIAGLPGAPGNYYDVSRWAYRHGVARRGRQGRGGGYEYNVGTMPEETQKALQSAPIYDESFSGDGALAEPAAINTLSMDSVETARLDILAALSRWESGDYPTLSEARRRFVKRQCQKIESGPVGNETWWDLVGLGETRFCPRGAFQPGFCLRKHRYEGRSRPVRGSVSSRRKAGV